jgi:putative ABC transport system ATP-binding protein
MMEANPTTPSPTLDIIIEAVDLWRIYKVGLREVQALRGINMQIHQGRFIALKGRSGSGKTTLLNSIGGLDKPTSGVIKVFDHDLAKLNERELTHFRSTQVGYIFQSFGLLPNLSAYENVELMLRICGASGKQRNQRTLEVLELVGLKRWMHHRPYELSGGQQQRVAIARALANRPRLILADEPTGELDTTTSREILGLFRQIAQREKLTLLMSSHDPLVDGYVDEILQLKDGQILQPESEAAIPGNGK